MRDATAPDLAAPAPADGAAAVTEPARVPPWRAAARALGISAAVLAAFFAPALDPAVGFLYRDSGRMHAPDKRLVAEALLHGRLAQWNPWGGLGFPLVGGGVDAVLHPFNLLLVLLPFDQGLKAWALASFLVAALGAFLWLRELGASEGAATAGGLALALGGYLVSSTDNLSYLTALASVPLLLAAAHAWIARGGAGRLALVGLASAFAAAAGDPQSWGIAVAALPLYAAALVARAGAGPLRRAARGLGAAGAAAIGAAPFLVPVLAWIPASSRGDPLPGFELERYNLLPVRALELALPGLFRPAALGYWSTLYEAYAGNPSTPLPWVLSEYAGAAAVALAAWAALRSRRAALLAAVAGAFLWMAMGRNAGFGQLAAHLPVLSSFRYWEKVAFFAGLLVAVGAALGIDAWAREAPRARGLAVATTVAAALLLAAAAAARLAPGALLAAVARPGYPAESARFAANVARALLHAGAALGAVALVAWAGVRGLLSPRARVLAMGAVVVGDLAAANVGAYVLSPYALQRPRSAMADRLAADGALHRVFTPFSLDDSGDAGLRPFERAALRGAASLQSGWNVDRRIGNFEPYTGMIPVRAWRYRLRTGSRNELPGVGMWGVGHVVVPGDPARAAEMGLAPPYVVDGFDATADAYLVRVPHRPRAYLADEVASVDRRGAMEFVLDPAAAASPRTVVEGPVPAGYAPPRGTARLVRDDPERVEIETDADRPALLVLDDSYAPGWTATVDGARAEILPANYLARGVWTPPGRHRVVFAYATPGLAAGWAIAAAGAAALAAAAVARRRRAVTGPAAAPRGRS